MPRLVQVLPGNPLPSLARRVRKVHRRRAAQNHRSSIVEGSQHAADIFVRAVTGPTFFQWAGRFALEIDQVGIALHHQHLAQVQVAMHPHQQATLGLTREVVDVLGKAVALLLQVVDQRLAVAVQVVAVLGQQVEGVGQVGTDLAAPAFAVLGTAWARLEGGIVGRCRQQQVHLAQALAEQGGETVEFGQGIGVGFAGRAGRFHLVADGPLQGVLGPGPGIALIAQVALGNHQQVLSRVLIHAADPSQQWRNVGIACGCQVGAHLKLGVNARVDPSDQFEHHAVSDHHRAVGLLGAQVAHWAVFAKAQPGQLFGARETQLAQAIAAGQLVALLTGPQHGTDERFKDERIGDQANLSATAHPR
ncbi:hypothetical protein D3C81_983320 [compost metagenome]